MKRLKFWGIGLVFVGLMFLVSVKAIAVDSLIPISCVSFDGGNSECAFGVAVDANGNIIITGQSFNGSNYDYLTIKYDSNLVLISSAIYDRSHDESGYAVATDSDDNIIVTGISSTTVSGYDFFTIKYDQNLIFISSVSYDGGTDECACAVAIDSNDNIIVTGYFGDITTTIENADWFTIKYDPNLVVIASAAYDGDDMDFATGIAIDSNNNIIVAGSSGSISNKDWITIKYDPNLVIISSVTYDKNNWIGCCGVAVDSNDNIIVGGNDYSTIKYDSNLAVLSSVTYNEDLTRYEAQGVVVDSNDDIIISGNCYFTIKYNSNFVLLSSTTYDDGNLGYAFGVAVDNKDDIIVIGGMDNGMDLDFFTIKYHGFPSGIFSVSPAFAKRGKTLDLLVNGLNFVSGAEITFSGTGITVNSVNFISSTQLKVNITIANNTSLGMKDITITNIEKTGMTTNAIFEVTALEAGKSKVKIQGGERGYVNPAKGEQARIFFKTENSGKIKIKIYTLKGQLVWEKTKESTGGEDFIIWDGKNKEGTEVASGIYVLYIDGPGINTTKKIAILK